MNIQEILKKGIFKEKRREERRKVERKTEAEEAAQSNRDTHCRRRPVFLTVSHRS